MFDVKMSNRNLESRRPRFQFCLSFLAVETWASFLKNLPKALSPYLQKSIDKDIYFIGMV